VTDTQKVKVSREEFAEALFYWLTSQVNTKKIKQLAKLSNPEHKEKELFGLNLEHKTEFNILIEELFDLNMWLIVHVCERVFEDTDKRDECLDIFHHIVYQRLLEEEEEDFDQWALSMSTRYIDYNKATKTENTLGPLWELATVVNKNLFGEVKRDPFIQTRISFYVTSSIEALEEALRKYDIE